jgi:L-serine/L-threonine ammonia-lyase
MLKALKRSTTPDNVHFYSSSGGNAGIAACHAAKFLGRPCTVVVPMTTNAMMVAKIKNAGAREVLRYGESVMHAGIYLRDVVMRRAEMRGEEAVEVMPFDHPDIWEGNATMMAEVKAQMEGIGEEAPNVVACSVGGGGMLNGVLQSVEEFEAQGAEGWERTDILGVETQGADSLAQSLDRDEHLTLPRITSQAVTLGCAKVSARTFELTRKHRATGRFKNAVYTDAEAAMGCWRFADDERMMVELSCGVTVALCYGGRLQRALGRPVDPEDKVVLVVCGGHGVTLGMIEQWRQEFGNVDAECPTMAFDDSMPSSTTTSECGADTPSTPEDESLPLALKVPMCDADEVMGEPIDRARGQWLCLSVV